MNIQCLREIKFIFQVDLVLSIFVGKSMILFLLDLGVSQAFYNNDNQHEEAHIQHWHFAKLIPQQKC